MASIMRRQSSGFTTPARLRRLIAEEAHSFLKAVLVAASSRLLTFRNHHRNAILLQKNARRFLVRGILSVLKRRREYKAAVCIYCAFKAYTLRRKAFERAMERKKETFQRMGILLKRRVVRGWKAYKFRVVISNHLKSMLSKGKEEASLLDKKRSCIMIQRTFRRYLISRNAVLKEEREKESSQRIAHFLLRRLLPRVKAQSFYEKEEDLHRHQSKEKVICFLRRCMAKNTLQKRRLRLAEVVSRLFRSYQSRKSIANKTQQEEGEDKGFDTVQVSSSEGSFQEEGVIVIRVLSSSFMLSTLPLAQLLSPPNISYLSIISPSSPCSSMLGKPPSAYLDLESRSIVTSMVVHPNTRLVPILIEPLLENHILFSSSTTLFDSPLFFNPGQYFLSYIVEYNNKCLYLDKDFQLIDVEAALGAAKELKEEEKERHIAAAKKIQV